MCPCLLSQTTWHFTKIKSEEYSKDSRSIFCMPLLGLVFAGGMNGLWMDQNLLVIFLLDHLTLVGSKQKFHPTHQECLDKIN
jgi:hypothetical protein